MATIRIDGIERQCSGSDTVLDVARRSGLTIPTLCHYPGLPHNTSCMVCLVEDINTQALLPACSARASDYAEIAATGERLTAARRAALELLLSEHLGDCEAPCRRGCPGFVDIPAVIRRLGTGDVDDASTLFTSRLPFPELLSEICPAPCERTCRRRVVDSPVRIRHFEAEIGRRHITASVTPAPKQTGKVAVIGGGPAGMAAAYYVCTLGYSCELFESGEDLGGGICSLVEAGDLDSDVLGRVSELLVESGVTLHKNSTVDLDDAFDLFAGKYDSVVIAAGKEMVEVAATLSGLGGVYLAGDAGRGRTTRMAVRSMAEGRRAAYAAHAWIQSGDREAAEQQLIEKKAFDSHAGKLTRDEIVAAMMGDPEQYSGGQIADEAARCLRCDCIGRASCSLRALSGRYGAKQRRFAADERPELERIADTDSSGRVISLEPGKCIRCGICIELSTQETSAPGLAFSGRGAGMRVRAPQGKDLWDAVPDTGRACVRGCPTGSLGLYPGRRQA